jgi:hypothetical protein
MMCGGALATFAGEPGRRGDPAGVSTHHFHDEYFGRGACHRSDV